MIILWRRAATVPVWAIWAVALGLGTLGASPVVTSRGALFRVAVVFGLAAMGSAALMLIRRLNARARTPNEAIRARNVRSSDATDIMRLDDDGG